MLSENIFSDNVVRCSLLFPTFWEKRKFIYALWIFETCGSLKKTSPKMLWKYYTSCYFFENNYHFHFHSGRRVSIGELVFSQNIVGFVMVGENGKACQNDSQVKKPQYILQNIRQLDEIKNQKTLDLLFNWKPDLDQRCKFVVVIFNLWVRCFPVFFTVCSRGCRWLLVDRRKNLNTFARSQAGHWKPST